MKLLLSVLLLVVSVGCGGAKSPTYKHRLIGLRLLYVRVKLEVSGGAPYYHATEKEAEIVWE